MKYTGHHVIGQEALVAPLVGAWIEIVSNIGTLQEKEVAPLVGAWIEIFTVLVMGISKSSLPSWERGLKYHIPNEGIRTNGRSPRGSVD